MENITVSLVQNKSNVNNIEKNFEGIKSFIEKASKAESDLIIFGECSFNGYTSIKEKINPIKLDNKYISALKKLAIENNIHIFIGMAEENNKNIYNSYLSINSLGDVDIYRKTHLGDKEKKIYSPGNKLKIISCKKATFGIAICIESHIPDIFTYYALNGVEAVILPFASPTIAGDRKKIWMKYLPARAYDNGIYVLAVNLVGDNGLNQTFSGGLMAISPNGEVIAEYFEKEEYMLTFNLNSQLIRNYKEQDSKTNYLIRRKPELYI